MSHDHHNHTSGADCCVAIEALAVAAHAIHDHHCVCELQEHKHGEDCCKASMKLVLDAMQLHIDCLRKENEETEVHHGN